MGVFWIRERPQASLLPFNDLKHAQNQALCHQIALKAAFIACDVGCIHQNITVVVVT